MGRRGSRWAFSEPRVLTDNDGVALPPEDQTQVATYGSFFEHEGRAIWWYPDRKHYLLGKIMKRPARVTSDDSRSD